MCIVIDPNVYPDVFRTDAREHHEYEPVLQWITEGKGFIVYGGKKYKKEMKRATRYHAIIAELDRKGKVTEVNGKMVDLEQVSLDTLIGAKSCDDCHIIAIFKVSWCRLFCSNDKRNDKYIKNRRFFSGGQKPPFIYRKRSHHPLLCKKNIVKIRNIVA